MSGPETLCPKCGFTPIPDGEEFCPRCHFRFIPEVRDVTYVTRTRAGGLTGSLTANPAPAAIVLAAGAVFWLLRASGVIAPIGESLWGFAIAAACAGAAALLMATVGPAKHAAILVGVLEIAAAVVLWLLGSPQLLLIASVAHGAILIAMTAEEPGRLRLLVGAVLGLAAAALGVVALLKPVLPQPSDKLVLKNVPAAYELALPSGWLGGPEPGLALLLPRDGGSVAFSTTTEPLRAGVLLASRDEHLDLDVACKEALRELGALSPVELTFPAPPVFGKPAKVADVKTATGATGRFACGLVSGRLLALAVVTQDPAPQVSVPAFEELSAGLELK